jgi:hypothetical protein
MWSVKTEPKPSSLSLVFGRFDVVLVILIGSFMLFPLARLGLLRR